MHNDALTRNSVTSFIIIAFLISYLIGIPFNMLVSALVQEKDEITSVLLPRLLTNHGPALSAILITCHLSGRIGTKSLLRKLVPQIKHFFLVDFNSRDMLRHHICVLYSGWRTLSPDDWVSNKSLAPPVVSADRTIHRCWNWRGIRLEGMAATATKSRKFIGCICTGGYLVWGLWHFPILLMGFPIVFPWLMMLCSLGLITAWLLYKVEGNILYWH